MQSANLVFIPCMEELLNITEQTQENFPDKAIKENSLARSEG